MTDFETFVSALTALTNDELLTVMGDESPVIPPTDDYGYELTPLAALVFGTMGCDGVHYAILKRENVIRDDSPVFYISPMDSDDPHCLLAPTFLDYLAIACGVTVGEMRSILDRERKAGNALVNFLRGHFSHSRFDLGAGHDLSQYSGMLVTRWSQNH